MNNLMNFISWLLRLESSKVLTDIAGGGEDGDCCVCLSSLADGVATQMLPCHHLFHKECVNRWLAACRRSCPLCRLRVDGQPSPMSEELTDELLIWFSSFHGAGF